MSFDASYTLEKRRETVLTAVSWANRFAEYCVPFDQGQAKAIVTNLKAFAYLGVPDRQEGHFQGHGWLFRPEQCSPPKSQDEGIAVIPCSTHDTPPLTRERGMLAYTNRQTPVIFIYDATMLTGADLGTLLLHEARHAYHRFPGFGNHDQLDSKKTHETNCWLMQINGLAACFNDRWARAVSNEVQWLRDQIGHLKTPVGSINIHFNSVYHEALDEMFGATNWLPAKLMRMRLLSTAAHAQYWSQKSQLTPEQVIHTIVRRNYE